RRPVRHHPPGQDARLLLPRGALLPRRQPGPDGAGRGAARALGEVPRPGTAGDRPRAGPLHRVQRRHLAPGAPGLTPARGGGAPPPPPPHRTARPPRGPGCRAGLLPARPGAVPACRALSGTERRPTPQGGPGTGSGGRFEGGGDVVPQRPVLLPGVRGGDQEEGVALVLGVEGAVDRVPVVEGELPVGGADVPLGPGVLQGLDVLPPVAGEVLRDGALLLPPVPLGVVPRGVGLVDLQVAAAGQVEEDAGALPAVVLPPLGQVDGEAGVVGVVLRRRVLRLLFLLLLGFLLGGAVLLRGGLLVPGALAGLLPAGGGPGFGRVGALLPAEPERQPHGEHQDQAGRPDEQRRPPGSAGAGRRGRAGARRQVGRALLVRAVRAPLGGGGRGRVRDR